MDPVTIALLLKVGLRFIDYLSQDNELSDEDLQLRDDLRKALVEEAKKV